MFPRALCCALAALVLGLTVEPVQAAPSASTAPAAGTNTTSYSVYSRKAGTWAWSEHRSYRSMAEANAGARQLHARGFEVQVHSRITMTHVPARPKTSALPVGQTVTAQQVTQIFRWLAGQRDIAFRYPSDGCYARAHLMIRRMKQRGLKAFKVWAFQNGDPLHVRTTNHPAGYVEWRYHIAPIVRVRFNNGNQRWYVIDPALFRKPVTIAQWRSALKKPGSRYTPYVTLTRLGQAPKDARGAKLPGSGYWPGVDPREGLDAHAVKMMRLYKPYEGRTPPRKMGASVHGPRTRALLFALSDRRRALQSLFFFA